MPTARASIRPEDLLAAGYRRFEDRFERERMRESYLGSYQRRFDDACGRRYFVTFVHTRILAADFDLESMTAHAHFSRGGIDFKVDTLPGPDGQTLCRIEAFFEELWTAMRLDYYGYSENRADTHTPFPTAAI